MALSHPLDGIRVKLERATEHLGELDAEIKRYVAQSPLDLVAEVDLDDDALRLKVESIRFPLPDSWSAIAGDIVHNLRCALDHLVWQLVLLNGGRPGTWTQFPILDKPPTSRKALKAWDRTLTDVAERDCQAIGELQPYQRDDADHHPLAALRDLSNEDKHRILLSAVSAIAPHEEATFQLLGTTDCEVVGGYEITVNQPLTVGTTVLTVQLVRTGPRPKVDAVGHLPFNVGFGTEMVDIASLFVVRDYVRDAIQAQFSGRFD